MNLMVALPWLVGPPFMALGQIIRQVINKPTVYLEKTGIAHNYIKYSGHLIEVRVY